MHYTVHLTEEQIRIIYNKLYNTDFGYDDDDIIDFSKKRLKELESLQTKLNNTSDEILTNLLRITNKSHSDLVSYTGDPELENLESLLFINSDN